MKHPAHYIQDHFPGLGEWQPVQKTEEKRTYYVQADMGLGEYRTCLVLASTTEEALTLGKERLNIGDQYAVWMATTKKKYVKVLK